MVGQKQYVAFYWTLPVSWVGFRALPDNADEAANVSKTIRYQLELTRRWVAEDKGMLIKEEVFLELAPDRGSPHVGPVLTKLIKLAKDCGAELLWVDFSVLFKWRKHGTLYDIMEDSGISRAIYPDPVPIDGTMWDPVDHFRSWDERFAHHRAGKANRNAHLLGMVRALKSSGDSLAKIARFLNDAGMKTHTGKNWTPDNVRKFLRGNAADQSTGSDVSAVPND